MKKALVLAAFAASTAYAGTPVKSEYFYQTEAQKHQVTPEINYTSDKLKGDDVTGTAQKTDITSQILNVRYEYGINEMFSAGAMAGYQMSGEYDQGAGNSSDNKGMTDITIFGKGNWAFRDGESMHYGANWMVSPGDQEIDQVKKESNAMSGGMTLMPWVGYQWMIGSGAVAGANLSTELDVGDRTVKTTTALGETTAKTTGGNETALTGFYEHPWDKTVVGVSLSYLAINTTEADTSGVTATTTGGNYWRLRVYPTYTLNESTTILGQIAYTSFLGDSFARSGTEYDVDSWNTLNIQVGGRFTF
jgi:hypothetical protein